MRGGKCNGTGLSASTDRTPRRPVINGRHATIQVKSRAEIKPIPIASILLVRRVTLAVANSLCPPRASWLISPAFDE
jgi:hypothetical protein